MNWINKPENNITTEAVCVLHVCSKKQTPDPCSPDMCRGRFCLCLFCSGNL